MDSVINGTSLHELNPLFHYSRWSRSYLRHDATGLVYRDQLNLSGYWPI